MKTIILMCVCLLSAFNTAADIYKSVDEEGTTTYKDTRDEDASEFIPPSMNAIPMPKWEPRPAPEQQARPQRYKLFTLIEPADNQTVYNNNGEVTVVVKIEPKLVKGHTLSILLDNKKMITDSEQLSHKLKAVDRGTHSVHAEIYSDKGKRIQSTNPAVFHMKRRSINQGKPLSGPVDFYGKLISPGPQTSLYAPGPVSTPATAE